MVTTSLSWTLSLFKLAWRLPRVRPRCKWLNMVHLSHIIFVTYKMRLQSKLNRDNIWVMELVRSSCNENTIAHIVLARIMTRVWRKIINYRRWHTNSPTRAPTRDFPEFEWLSDDPQIELSTLSPFLFLWPFRYYTGSLSLACKVHGFVHSESVIKYGFSYLSRRVSRLNVGLQKKKHVDQWYRTFDRVDRQPCSSQPSDHAHIWITPNLAT